MRHKTLDFGIDSQQQMCQNEEATPIARAPPTCIPFLRARSMGGFIIIFISSPYSLPFTSPTPTYKTYDQLVTVPVLLPELIRRDFYACRDVAYIWLFSAHFHTHTYAV